MVYFKAATSLLIAAATIAPVLAAGPAPKIDPNAIQTRDVSEGKDSDVPDKAHHSHHHHHDHHRAQQSSGKGGEEVTIVVHDRVEDKVNGEVHHTHTKSHRNGHRHSHNHRQHGTHHRHSGKEEVMEEDITIVIRPENGNGGHRGHKQGAAHRAKYAHGLRHNGDHGKSGDLYDESYNHPHHGDHRRPSYRYEDEGSGDYRPRHHRHGSRSGGHRYFDELYDADDQVEEHHHHHHHDGSTYRTQEQPSPRYSNNGSGGKAGNGGSVRHRLQGEHHSSHRAAYYSNDGLRASERTDDIEGPHSSHPYHDHRNAYDDESHRDSPEERPRHHHRQRMEKQRLSGSDFQEPIKYSDLD